MKGKTKFAPSSPTNTPIQIKTRFVRQASREGGGRREEGGVGSARWTVGLASVTGSLSRSNNLHASGRVDASYRNCACQPDGASAARVAAIWATWSVT